MLVKNWMSRNVVTIDANDSMQDAMKLLKEHDIRMVSLLTSYNDVQNGYRKVYMRMRGIERSQLQKLKKNLGEKAALLYVIDHRLNSSEIYSEKINYTGESDMGKQWVD